MHTLSLLLSALACLAAAVLQELEGLQPEGASQPHDCTYKHLYPRQYVCYKTTGLSPATLDGDLTKDAWREVAWTEDFVDISTATRPELRTRAKLRWDDSYLYVGAELEEPQVWGTLVEDDTVIFHDNDFEVFVDPGGTNHFYKEFEMNALNARWSLMLNKPYGDGGVEDSTRVDKLHGWTMLPGTRSAVKVVPKGAINDPAKRSIAWTVEIALPLAALTHNDGTLPQDGGFWRLGFSRVEWHAEVDNATNKFVKRPKCQSCPTPGAPNEDNWVWSPQHAINMHAPELWGIIQFSAAAVNSTTAVAYDQWPIRSAAMALYYAEKAYAKDHGDSYSGSLTELAPYSAPPFELCPEAQTTIDIGPRGSSFRAVVQSPEGPWAATITDDRFLTVTERSL